MSPLEVSAPGVEFDVRVKPAVAALAIAASPETAMLAAVAQVNATMDVVPATSNAGESMRDGPVTVTAVEFEFATAIVTVAANLTLAVVVASAAATPNLSSIPVVPAIPHSPNL